MYPSPDLEERMKKLDELKKAKALLIQ